MAERSPRNMTDYEAEYAALPLGPAGALQLRHRRHGPLGQRAPDAPALLQCDDRGNRKGFSWRELAERSLHAALLPPRPGAAAR